MVSVLFLQWATNSLSNSKSSAQLRPNSSGAKLQLTPNNFGRYCSIKSLWIFQSKTKPLCLLYKINKRLSFPAHGNLVWIWCVKAPWHCMHFFKPGFQCSKCNYVGLKFTAKICFDLFTCNSCQATRYCFQLGIMFPARGLTEIKSN